MHTCISQGKCVKNVRKRSSSNLVIQVVDAGSWRIVLIGKRFRTVLCNTGLSRTIYSRIDITRQTTVLGKQHYLADNNTGHMTMLDGQQNLFDCLVYEGGQCHKGSQSQSGKHVSCSMLLYEDQHVQYSPHRSSRIPIETVLISYYVTWIPVNINVCDRDKSQPAFPSS